MTFEEDEAEYHRIARRETHERVDRILRAVRGADGPRWEEVYRQAHTLAGIAGDVDASIAASARRLASRLRDERGVPVPLREGELLAIAADVELLAEAARQLQK